jgi:nucleoside 2-deoxyribosyltransferase
VKFYTASKFERFLEVRYFNDQLRELGHTVTWDWTRTKEFNQFGYSVSHAPLHPDDRLYYARADVKGAREADAVILLDGPDLRGALVEAGIAIGAGKELWLVEPWKPIIFDALHVSRIFAARSDVLTFLQATAT